MVRVRVSKYPHLQRRADIPAYVSVFVAVSIATIAVVAMIRSKAENFNHQTSIVAAIK